MALSAAERQARHYAKHPEECRARWRSYSRTSGGTATVLLNYARARARRAGLPFMIDRDFVEQKLARGVCEVSGLPIERVPPARSRVHPFAPSLDRIKPKLGYTPENTRLVCFIVNRAKSDWDDEALLRMALAIVLRAAG